MNTFVIHTTDKTGNQWGGVKKKLHIFGIPIDIIAFISLLLYTNTHLLTGDFNDALIFIPSAVASGEWWRVITHPFVHLSWYHMLLDAGAFFLLYRDIADDSLIKKLFYIIVCGAFSLLTALVTSPMIYAGGLCGLSGIAHGLMAISGLEMMHKKEGRTFGFICFILVVAKSMYEMAAGDVVFSFMHMGLCGTPVAACHAGGVLGGIIAYSTVSMLNKHGRSSE